MTVTDPCATSANVFSTMQTTVRNSVFKNFARLQTGASVLFQHPGGHFEGGLCLAASYNICNVITNLKRSQK